MNSRQVLFVALVAMAVAPAFGGDSLGSKLEALAADKHAPVFGTVPCPEDADKKVPIIAMSEAPCKQICKNVCTTDLTKSCSTVPVVSKVCTPTKKTVSKRVCSKRCTLTVETFHPNPSTPPTVEASAASSAGRRLSGLIDADLTHKKQLTTKMMKSLPEPECDKVCETVHFEVPDLECHKVTQETEICKMVPVHNCHQECMCIPHKTHEVKMLNKKLDISVNKP